MKKYIWISFLILLVLGCGSRNRKMTKQTEASQLEDKSSGSQNTALNSQVGSFTSLSQFLSDKSLKITSNGTPYQLQYGSLIFSGNADVEFNEKNEETKYIYKYFNHITYLTETKYQRNIKYQSQKTFKSIDVERKGISFGGIIWIIAASLIAGAILWEILKKYLPTWALNLFKRK